MALITITGDNNANVLTGTNATDQYNINGLGGNDDMHGNALNDTLNGGAGDDHMGGGAGNDVYIVDSVNDFVHEENGLVGGVDRIDSSVTFTLTDVDVENLTLTGVGVINGTGNSANNTLTGNAMANTLSGMAGNDTMLGGAGNDRLDGGTGDDHMHGEDGNDVYIVDSLNDVVHEFVAGAVGGIDRVESSVTFELGDNLENLLGHVRYAIFYIACGLAAATAQIIMGPDSIIPMLGASGAISGVLGGYVLLFPQRQVRAIIFRFLTTVPAYVAIGIWIVYQLVLGYMTDPGTGGVAYAAHIGGFIAGLALVKVFAMGRQV